MPVPRHGSKVTCFCDIQYRWKSRSTKQGSEIHAESNEVINGQMLIAQLPKVLDLRWLDDVLEFGLAHGWSPMEKKPDFIIRKTRDGYKVIS